MNPANLATGELFAGRYRILRGLAKGGMGAVYEVLHVETDRRRALKVMLPEIVASREFRERFQLEARVTGPVQSENIVEVFDAGVDEATGMPFMVMELLEGEELGSLVEQSGPLDPRSVVTYLRQAGAALDKTHARAIVHRDLKPGNLFLTRREDGSPRIKILDFGISKVVNVAAGGSTDTSSVGTPLYMAPEQVAGGRISPATDIYSFGLIAYTLLVGLPYWQDESERVDNLLAVAMQAAAGPSESAVARATRRGRNLPVEFDAWFARATHRDPAERFARASEAANALAAVFGIPIEQTARVLAVQARTPAHVTDSSLGAEPAASTAPGTELEPQQANKHARPLPWLAAGAAALGAAVSVALLLARSTHDPTQGAAASSEAIDRAWVDAAPSAAPTALHSAAPAAGGEAAPDASAKPPAAPPRATGPSSPRPTTRPERSTARPAAAAAPPHAAASAASPAAVVKPRKYTRD